MLANQDFCRDTIELVKAIETRFLELGARLYKISEKKLWEGNYDSFNDFLINANVNKGTASKLVNIYRSYVIDGGVKVEQLAGVPYTNLYQAIPLIEKEGADRAAVLAETLTKDEIKEELREQKFGVHEHVVVGDERWGVCTCGKFVKIDENHHV